MTRINIHEMETLLSNVQLQKFQVETQLSQLQASITTFVDDESNSSAALDNVKDYWRASYLKLTSTALQLLSELAEKLEKYIVDFYTEVDDTGGSLDLEELCSVSDLLDTYENRREAILFEMTVGETCSSKLGIDSENLRDLRKNLDILYRYQAFERKHRVFFDELSEDAKRIESALDDLQAGIAFIDTEAGYDVPKVTARKWFTDLTEKNSKEQKELLKNTINVLEGNKPALAEE